MLGHKDGTLHMNVNKLSLALSDEAHQNASTLAMRTSAFSHKVTTANNLSRELFSIDDMYSNQGYSILLKAPGYGNGIPEIHVPASGNEPSYSIPLRYDKSNGGFWLDYTLSTNSDYQIPSELSISKYNAMMLHTEIDPSYTDFETIALISTMYACNSTAGSYLYHCTEYGCEAEFYGCSANEIIQHPEATTANIRGVKAGLRTNKKQMTVQDFHDEYGHLGCVGPCVICVLAHGCMRKITRAVDSYVEVRRAYFWDGDILTWEQI
jgi:hypothetical protein